MTIFHSTRFKLTAWYLLIIMVISVMFSAIIFRALTAELDRFQERQRVMLERLQDISDSFDPMAPPRRPVRQPLNPELILEIKQRLLLMLLATDLGIFVISAGLGYFLAGRTLQPIKKMMDEQRRFISDASHELKTPLATMRTEFEVALLDENQLTLAESRRVLRSGLEEIVTLQNLTEHLIQIDKSQQQQPLKLQRVSLVELTDAAIKKVLPQAKHKHISIDNHVKDGEVAGEPHTLSELLVIVLDNAIKYSPAKSRVELRATPAEHDMLLELTDHGIGIAEKDLSQIFDRFYRADTSRSEVKGYGLGLSIAKQIVEAHHGKITLASELKKGTTVTIRLPKFQLDVSSES